MARGTVAKKIRGLGTDGNFLTNKICYIILFEKIIIKLIQTHRPPSICKPYSPIILTFNGLFQCSWNHTYSDEGIAGAWYIKKYIFYATGHGIVKE